MPQTVPTASKAPASVPKQKATEAVFDVQYAKLNDSQKLAVDTLEGPVMVVAGPGTGKTEVVSLRVANILKQTQMRPSNVLCLTFSVSGAVAMRERLRRYIGPDAYGVTVKNFHGFCNDLILEHPLVFDSWSALEQISDVERYRLVNRLIDELLPNCVLVSKKQPYLRTRDIIGRISQLKREGTTDPKQLEAVVAEYQQQMSTKSKEGTKAHEKNLLAARKFKEFIKLFNRYQEELKASQRYDYEDMILFVTQALKEEDWLLQSIQERFQYILVDEFQDTNGAQYQLINQLTTYATLDADPNLFVVGDDDQAIYRFQGANLHNILSFHERFPEAPVIPLTTSYRCPQAVLDAASNVIDNNEERLVNRVPELDKTLQAAPARTTNTAPALLLSPSDATEPWLVADLVEARLQAGQDPSEIAIIVQKNAEILSLFDVLTARDIPVQMSGKVDLLSNPYVMQAVAILRAIEHPSESSTLAAALACECFALHPADLAELYAWRRSQELPLMDVLLQLDGEAGTELALRNKDAVQQTRDTLLDLHQKKASRTVVETLEHILKDTGLLAYAKGETKADFHAVHFAALQEFFDRLKYRAYEQASFSLETFLSDLEYYQTPEYSDLRMSYDLPHLTETGVQLMTAHQSKGLEFNTVILYQFRHGHWDAKRSPASLSVPEDLLFGWEGSQKTFEKTQDERRLTYVAMTRAKEELLFTCPKQLTSGDRSRDVSPSAFFAEAGQLSETLQELRQPDQAAELLFDPVVISDESYRAFLLQRLENFGLSVTALNHFLEDPQIFLEIDLLQTPQSKQASLVYGNAVHDTMRKWAVAVQQGKPMDKDAFMVAFHQYLNERELLTQAEKERLKALGEEALPRYFETKLANESPVIYKIECPINTVFNDIPIKGKLDRIDLEGPDNPRATILDFKTGRPKSENQILEGDYFRQLAFYGLLLKHQTALPIEPITYTLDFIGEGTEHPVARSFSVSEQQIADLEKLVTQVWEKILALDFSPL